MNPQVLSLLSINLMSFLAYILIHREVNRLVDAHIHIIHKKNTNVVLTSTLKIIRMSYLLVVVGMAFFSYHILF